MGPDAQYVGKVGFLFNWLKRGGKKNTIFISGNLLLNAYLTFFSPPPPFSLLFYNSLQKEQAVLLHIIHVPPTTPNPLSSDVKYSGLICKGV